MTMLRRHPFRSGCAGILLLLALLSVASAEPSERSAVTVGLAMIGGAIVVVGWGVARIWRIVAPKREHRQDQPLPASMLPDLPSPLPDAALPTAEQEAARPIEAHQRHAGFGSRLALALGVHAGAGLTVGCVLGFYLELMAQYYQSRGMAGERTAPPNDAATDAYRMALWVGVWLWVAAVPVIVGITWWTRRREMPWSLLIPLAWAALWIAFAVGLTVYGSSVAHWE